MVKAGEDSEAPQLYTPACDVTNEVNVMVCTVLRGSMTASAIIMPSLVINSVPLGPDHEVSAGSVKPVTAFTAMHVKVSRLSVLSDPYLEGLT